MKIFKKIFISSFWLLLGNSVGKVAMFLTNIVAARLLSQEVFGQFTMIRSTINMGGNIISGSLGLTATKKVAELISTNKNRTSNLLVSIFSTNLVITLIISLFVLFSPHWIINSFFLGTSGLVKALYIGLLILITSTFSTLVQNILIGFEQYKIPAFLSFIVTIIAFPLIILLIFHFNLYGALFSVSLYFFLDFFLKSIFLRKKYRNPDYHINIKNIIITSRSLVSFSLPITLAMILNAFSFWYARVLVVNESQGFSDIAVFDAAYQWLTIIMLITGATTSVALPMLTKSFGKQNKKETLKIFYLNLLVNFFIAFLFAVFIILFSKPIMGLYGQNYTKGNFVLIILSISSILFSISSIYNKFMITHNQVWAIFIASLLGICVLFGVLTFSTGSSAVVLAWSFFAYYTTITIVYIIFSMLTKKIATNFT